MSNIYDRTIILLGEKNLEKIKKSKVCIIGIGGVGSYTLEALVRIGIGNITIIDKDIVDASNINRQIIATTKNIGKSKVDEAKKRINEINPEIIVTAIQDFVDENNINEYIDENFDYVIDAVDSVNSKVAIIKRCKDINVKIISSMGTANKLDPLKIKVSDVSKTEVCPLAKIIRKKLKEQRVSKVKVVYSTENPIKNNNSILGSVSYVPSTAGLIIASEVIKDIISVKES